MPAPPCSPGPSNATRRGFITKEDAGGLELRWGDGEVMNQMVEELAYRRGIGDLLAEGGLEAARRLGQRVRGLRSPR